MDNDIASRKQKKNIEKAKEPQQVDSIQQHKCETHNSETQDNHKGSKSQQESVWPQKKLIEGSLFIEDVRVRLYYQARFKYLSA